MKNSKEVQLQATYNVLHQLKGIFEKSIKYRNNEIMLLEVYTNANYAKSIVNKRSTTSYCTFLIDNLVT